MNNIYTHRNIVAKDGAIHCSKLNLELVMQLQFLMTETNLFFVMTSTENVTVHKMKVLECWLKNSRLLAMFIGCEMLFKDLGALSNIMNFLKNSTRKGH